MPMNTRQEQLLTLVIEKYIATAQPIGSKVLVSEAGLDWSEATVRNELRELEEMGYLTHPHTSAGRIPTEAGYKYYIEKTDWEKIRRHYHLVQQARSRNSRDHRKSTESSHHCQVG